MQIVIDIDEWKYKSICEGVEASKRCGVATMNPVIDEAIYKGIPLPKGHGRLKDVDDLDVTTIETDDYDGNEVLDVVLKEDIDEAPTIIPADESEEGQ